MRRPPVQPRVAIVVASPAIIGGHSVQAASLASALASDGVDVELVAIDRPLPFWCAWVRRVMGLRTIVNELCYLGALRQVVSADVVHAFSASYWSFLLAPVPAMLAGRMAGRRVVLHYHSGEVAEHLARWGWLVHPWLRLPDVIVVCSRFQQAAFSAYGYDTRVIPNVVNLSRFAYRDRHPLKPRFVCTRNLETHYGVETVLRAFRLVRERHSDAELVIAGAGPEASRLEAEALRLGPSGIRFVGAVSPEAMPRLLDAADIYLNGSTVDNQPVSIIEAQASGLPVVSTPVGGIGELIEHGRSGLLVGVSDPEAMAAAALSLLEQPGHARTMTRRAREAATRFSWEAVRDEWRQVYGLRAARRRNNALDTESPVSISTRGVRA